MQRDEYTAMSRIVVVKQEKLRKGCGLDAQALTGNQKISHENEKMKEDRRHQKGTTFGTPRSIELITTYLES